MPAHLKLRGRRERRLLALLSFGESLTAACRAVDIAPQTVNRRRRADPIFAELLRVARENRVGAIAPELPDWRVVAAQLEAEYPERWSLPGEPSDPLGPDGPLDAFAEFDPRAP